MVDGRWTGASLTFLNGISTIAWNKRRTGKATICVTFKRQSMWAEIDPIAATAIGLLGGVLMTAAVYVAAVHWKRRAGLAYCLPAFLIYVLLFVATYRHSVVNADTGLQEIPEYAVTALLLGQAAISAFGVAVAVLAVFGLYLSMLPRLDRPVNRVRAYGSCAIVCMVIAVLFNPNGAVRKLETPAAAAIIAVDPDKVDDAIHVKAKETVAKLRELGVITRIETDETAITHYVSEHFLALTDDVVEEYARAAFVHHIHYDSGSAKSVILRESNSGRRIAIRDKDGTFQRF